MGIDKIVKIPNQTHDTTWKPIQSISYFESSTWYSDFNHLSIPMFYQNKCSLTAFIDNLLNWTLY